MPVCPICNARIPLRLALKTTDVLLFPEEGAEKCPACHAKLVPTTKSIVSGVFAFLVLAAVCFLLDRFGRIGGYVPGFIIGLASGLLISLGGVFFSATLLRFRATMDDRYAYDRRGGLGILDSAPRE